MERSRVESHGFYGYLGGLIFGGFVIFRDAICSGYARNRRCLVVCALLAK